MPVTGVKGRLVSDPAIAVSDLMNVVEDHMKEKKSRDLEKVLQVPKMTSWRTGVDVAWLAYLAPLFKRFAAVAPNTMLPPKKFRTAVMNLNQQQKTNFGSKSDDDHADYIDQMCRIAFAQYRQLAQSAEASEKAFRKASPLQVSAIEEVLRLLNVDPPTSASDPSQAPTSANPSPPPPVAAPSTPETTTKPVATPTGSETATRPIRTDSQETLPGCPSIPIDPEAVFAAVLAETEDTEPDPRLDTPPAKKAKFQRASSPFGFDKFIGEEFDSAEDEDRHRLLREAYETIPLGENGESQLTIFRNHAAKKPGAKTGSAGPSKAAKMMKGEKKSDQTQKPKPKTKAMKAPPKKIYKKPSAASETLPVEDEECETAENRDEVATPSVKQSLVNDGESEPEGAEAVGHEAGEADPASGDDEKDKKPGKTGKKPLDMSRVARRKRVVSKAWHSKYDEMIGLGKSKSKARTEARKAHKLAGEDFDEKEPLVRKTNRKALVAKPDACEDVARDGEREE